MSRGFFIFINKPRSGSNKLWTANYIETLRGWSSSKGIDIEETIQLQKKQYHAKIDLNEPVPELLHNWQCPMACGKVTRFVEVENNDNDADDKSQNVSHKRRTA